MNFDSLQYPFPSRRTVVYSRRGVVSTGQNLAAQAGLEALRHGGNAIDAAVATAACLTVTEPSCNGIGGDAFAIVWYQGKLYGLNASGPAPLALDAQKLRALGHSKMPATGWAPVTVPGAPSAWQALTRRFGKLSLSQAVEPGARYAEEGYPVSPMVAENWIHLAETFHRDLKGEKFRPWFDTFTRDGRAPRPGELFRLPDHAATLREIGRTGAESFYRGALAERIAAFARQTGGYLTGEDLAAYQPDWVQPLRARFRGHDVWELPPNGHGLVALIALNILEGFDPAPLGDAEGLHRRIEAVKLAFADGLAAIADPQSMTASVEELLSPAYAGKRRALISGKALFPAPGDYADHGTVYLATADGEGNMVSYIQSNYMGFGSGLVVPGTGIALHNRGANFSLDPGSPNCLRPGRRPYHTIIPGFLTRDDEAVGPFGVMGGFMQPQGHVQAVVNLLDFGMNPQAALDAPRFRWNQGLSIALEEGFDPALVQDLADRGHDIKQEPVNAGFGRGQIILRAKDGVLATGCEPRADSMAAAW